MDKLKRLFFRFRSLRLRAAQDRLSATTPVAREETQACQEKAAALLRLEELPLDIRHQILLAVDCIQDMAALVHASPSYYRLYRPRRDFWLWRCFWLEIDLVFVDAYTAHLCSSVSFQRQRSMRTMEIFITAYNTRRLGAVDDLLDSLNENERQHILNFHLLTVRPLLYQYIAWTRANLGHLSGSEYISRIEKQRIFRGLYRFHICCQIFGFSEYDDETRYQIPQIIGRFLSDFEPWEREEVLCINAFSLSSANSAFDSVAWDLHPNNPRFHEQRQRRCYTPDGALDMNDIYNRERFLFGIVSLGLVLLRTICTPPDHAALVQAISSNLVSMSESWVDKHRYDFEEDGRRAENYSERDRAQDRRDPMPFVGDKVDSPPLAWVTIWSEIYSNLYGFAIPEDLRNWGFVMWDSQRLRASGALKAIDQRWKDMKAGRRRHADPRGKYWEEYDRSQAARI